MYLIILEIRYFAKGLSKILGKSEFVIWLLFQSQKLPEIIYWEVLVFSGLLRDLFEPLIQRGFSSFLKVEVSNLYNPIHDATFIPFSSS